MSATPNLGGHFAPAASQPLRMAASVESKAERIRSHAEAHYERHAKHWVASRYTQLLLREAPQPSLRPDGVADDRKAHLFRAASHLVERKQQGRLIRIEKAAQRMSGLSRDDGIGR